MYNNIKKLVKTRNMYTFCTGHQGLSFCNPATQTSLVLPSNSFYPRGTSIQNNAVQPWEMLFPAIREVKIGAWYRCRHGSPTSSSMLCMRTILPITMVIPWHGKKSGAEICFVCFFFSYMQWMSGVCDSLFLTSRVVHCCGWWHKLQCKECLTSDLLVWQHLNWCHTTWMLCIALGFAIFTCIFLLCLNDSVLCLPYASF